MKYDKLVNDILSHIGGKDNILDATHCMTRLRLTLKDNNLVNKESLENTRGVSGLILFDSQLQIVIGPQVSSVYKEFIEITGSEYETAAENKETVKKQMSISGFFEVIAGIFNPIVPALAGAGLVRAILTIAVVLGLDDQGNTFTVIDTIANSIFVFLPFLLAVSAARQFKMNQYIALTICAALLSGTWANLIADGNTSFSFLKIPFTLVNYSSSVIPIVFAVWFASYVERFFDKFIPNALKIILVPCFTIVVATPIILLTIGPAATLIGNVLAGGLTGLFEKGGAIAGAIYGAIYSSMVVLGVHHGMVPVLVQGITQNGFNIISPTSGAANMGQAGAAFGVWLKTKNTNLKAISGSAAISAVTGVTEPAIYGVNFKLKKPFLAAAIGGGVGGGLASLLGLKAYAMGGPSFLNFAMFIGDDPKNVWLVMLAFAVSFIVAAISTYFMWEER